MACKTVLITGGTRGIGRAILDKFLENDFNIICIYKNSHNIAKKLQENEKIRCFSCDISNNNDVLELSKKLSDTKIDIIINNASISSYGLFTDTTQSDFDDIFNTNVRGTFNITHAFIKPMISRKDGVIVNISSMWGEVGASLEVLYSASKGAIIAFTKALAKEMGLSNIRVNCVSPGVILTDMLDDFSKENLDTLKEETPLNRLGTPNDIAETVYFLASDNASFITGQTISVNGGFVI